MSDSGSVGATAPTSNLLNKIDQPLQILFSASTVQECRTACIATKHPKFQISPFLKTSKS
jgi:hypothetical protein